MMIDACAQSADASQAMNAMSSFRAVVSARVTPEIIMDFVVLPIRSILLCSSIPYSKSSFLRGCTCHSKPCSIAQVVAKVQSWRLPWE